MKIEDRIESDHFLAVMDRRKREEEKGEKGKKGGGEGKIGGGR